MRKQAKSKIAWELKPGQPLTARQRRLIRELSAILRIANGLDDGELQTVREVRVRLRRKSVRFQFHATPNALIDVAALQRKARPFAQAFGMRVGFKRGRSAAQPPRPAQAAENGQLNSWKPPLTGNVWTLSA